jgi:protein-tyrosine phosphatase
VAAKHGVELPGSARRVRLEDFFEFQFVLAMDGSNLEDLKGLESGSEADAVIRLLLEFDPEAAGELDVPDPYYGGPDGFDKVYKMVDRACEALVEHLEQELGA